MATDTWRWAAVSCSHAPYLHRQSFSKAIEIVRAHNCDAIVHLGDALDAQTASKYPAPDGHLYTLQDEFQQLKEVLGALVDATPNAKRRVYLDGNHEYNLFGNPGRVKADQRAAIAQNATYIEATKGWLRKPYGARSYWTLGQITFSHGVQCGVNAERSEALLYGSDNGLYIMGHTHRDRPVTRIELPGKIPIARWFANPGCMTDWDRMEYVKKINTEMWGHAVVIGECRATGEGRDHYRRRQWEAETITINRRCGF